MISSLRGSLIEVNPPKVVVEVAGVGYLLNASMTTIYQLPPIGTEVFIYTHMVVREDAHLLFGFLKQEERSVFQEITKINGVGPKVALSLLSHLSIQEFFTVVQKESLAQFKKIPGVGPKIAQRIILDLKDKIHKFTITDNDKPLQQILTSNIDEAFEALIALGYKNKEAQKAIDVVQNQGKIDTMTETQIIIKEALRGLAKI